MPKSKLKARGLINVELMLCSTSGWYKIKPLANEKLEVPGYLDTVRNCIREGSIWNGTTFESVALPVTKSSVRLLDLISVSATKGRV